MLNNQRLYILNNQDFSSTYDRLRFNDLERRHFFVLSEPELQIVKLKPFNGRETSSKLAYNMCILSELYEIKLQQGDKAAIEFLKHISPIASQHINIGDLYEFTEEMQAINFNAVVDAFTKILDETLKEA